MSVRPVISYPLKNIRRYATGLEAFDKIYGSTEYIHLNGPLNGQPTGLVEYGLPESYTSMWAGTPGGGKTRLAIAIAKALNKQGYLVHFYEGEGLESQFRSWCGSDVHPTLFCADIRDALDLEEIVYDTYAHQPKVVIIDSLQIVKQFRSHKRNELEGAVDLIKQTKADPKAGFPHFIFINQVIKSGKMAGAKYIEHMADFIGFVERDRSWPQGVFRFSTQIKNRAGPTPAMEMFRHTSTGVEQWNYRMVETRRGPKLVQTFAQNPQASGGFLGWLKAMNEARPKRY